MRKVKLTNSSLVALVDEDDYFRVIKHKCGWNFLAYELIVILNLWGL